MSNPCEPSRIKAIPGFERYGADEDGRIWSLFDKARLREVPRRMKTAPNTRGYEVASVITDDRKKKNVTVHRLVLMTFSGPCPDGMEGAHLDGDKTNNRAVNLRWVTRSENMLHKQIHGTEVVGSAHKWAKISERTASDIKRRLAEGDDQTTIARDLDCSLTLIHNIKMGNSWKHVPALNLRKVVTLALIGQAWAVACMAMWTEEWAQMQRGSLPNPCRTNNQQADRQLGWTIGIADCSTKNLQRLAALPAPAELAAEILGGEEK